MAVKLILVLLLGCVELFIVQTFVDGFKIVDHVYQANEHFIEGAVSVQAAVPSQEDWLRQHQKYSAFCGKDAVKVVMPTDTLSEVKVLGSSILDPVLGATKECGYSLIKEQGNDVLSVSFSSCHVTIEEGRYVLRLLYVNNMDSAEIATVSCDVNTDMAFQKVRVPRSDNQADCPPAPMPAMTPNRRLPKNYTNGGCDIPTNQRLPCGPAGTTAVECMNKGCCMDVTTSFCYYPMDQCTADGQFVFTIYSNITTIPVSPTSLQVAAKTPCKPILATNDFATFKFSVSECGTKTYNIGDTTVYMAEVRTAIRVLNLKYGVITRDHLVRVMVECRYSKISPTMIRASAGYMVVSPTVPSSVRAGGLYGVQLRIATDETFSSFLRSSHVPLNALLGKPLYLEVQLKSPKPEATLLINYCVAYTRSGTNALVLLYEGCPNPELSSGQSSFLRVLDMIETPHQRRFVVTAFQFMNVTTQKYINEEIYFMCSTEVCMPPTPCRKTCFDGKV